MKTILDGRKITCQCFAFTSKTFESSFAFEMKMLINKMQSFESERKRFESEGKVSQGNPQVFPSLRPFRALTDLQTHNSGLFVNQYQCGDELKVFIFPSRCDEVESEIYASAGHMYV